MDVVLEAFNTYMFDRFWALVVPADQPTYLANILKDHLPSVTFSSMREAPTAFLPASQYLSFEPGPYAHLSALPRDNIWRQAVTLFLITWLFGFVIYFVFATLSYYLIFDHATFTHPKFLKNQVRLEIKQSLQSFHGIALCTTPFFLLEVRGYSKLYDAPRDAPFAAYNVLQFPIFLLFTDLCVYFIHRALHHPLLYKPLHKAHHKWIMPTPFASHAFHPLDGFAQGIPYHVFAFLFPLQKFAYIALFVFINIWTVMIHDGEYVANSPIINGAACHTMHHLYFNYNYGQYTTLWDRLGGSYRPPNAELFRRESKMSATEWQRQVREMETVQRTVEGDDERDYGDEAARVAKKVM